MYITTKVIDGDLEHVINSYNKDLQQLHFSIEEYKIFLNKNKNNTITHNNQKHRQNE
jgi:hypothetical protein